MGFGNAAADMQDLLSHAKMLLGFDTFEALRQDIVDDEIPIEDREDDELGEDATRQYIEVIAMDAPTFLNWYVSNSLEGTLIDRDYAGLAYTSMTMARIQDFINEEASDENR